MTIARMTLATNLEDQRQKLALKAQEVLGYSKLAHAISIRGALMYTLRELGIAPLDEAGVDEYKASKATTGMWSGHKWAIFWFALMAVSFGVSRSMVHRGDTYAGVGVGTLIAGVACFFFAAFAGLNSDFKGHRTVRSWRRCSLRDYNGNVPEFALDKAVRIKEQLPDARFSVDYLVGERQNAPLRVYSDPFLLVKFTSGSGYTEEYYLDVWNEREYERTM